MKVKVEKRHANGVYFLDEGAKSLIRTMAKSKSDEGEVAGVQVSELARRCRKKAGVRWRPGGGLRSPLWRRLGKKLAMGLDIDVIKSCDAEMARDVRNTKNRGRYDGSNGHRDWWSTRNHLANGRGDGG